MKALNWLPGRYLALADGPVDAQWHRCWKITGLLCLLVSKVLPLLMCVFVPKAAFLQQDIYCRDHLEYQHAGICCLNCPAGARLSSIIKHQQSWKPFVFCLKIFWVCVFSGKRLISHCKTAGTRGVCVECDDGTYTEHANNLRQCFKCTQCRPGNSARWLDVINRSNFTRIKIICDLFKVLRVSAEP